MVASVQGLWSSSQQHRSLEKLPQRRATRSQQPIGVRVNPLAHCYMILHTSDCQNICTYTNSPRAKKQLSGTVHFAYVVSTVQVEKQGEMRNKKRKSGQEEQPGCQSPIKV